MHFSLMRLDWLNANAALQLHMQETLSYKILTWCEMYSVGRIGSTSPFAAEEGVVGCAGGEMVQDYVRLEGLYLCLDVYSFSERPVVQPTHRELMADFSGSYPLDLGTVGGL